MKTSNLVMMKADDLKTYRDMMGKAGTGIKLAAMLGYKFGFGMAKHPYLHKFKKQIEHHPTAGVLALTGIVIGAIGLVGFLMNSKKI